MGEAEKIVDLVTTSGRPSLDLTTVERIIKSKNTQNLPTIIISIAGVARSGKSFLLNLIVNYLQYVETNGTHVDWETSDGRVQGINWAQSKKAVTRGIWMWNTPYRIHRRDGSEVAVLLIDSQGTSDNTLGDPKLDTIIMYISLELSSFQLLNVQSYLTSTELTSLQLCTDYADLNPGDSGGAAAAQVETSLFGSLMFIVRNYQGDDQEPGERPYLFQEILAEGTNPELLKAVRGIKKAFSEITSYAFPHPGAKIANATVSKKEWRLSDVPQDFLNTVKLLCVNMFDTPHQDVIDTLSGAQQLERFELLKFQLESTDMPDIGTPADALQESILYRAYAKGKTAFSKSLKKIENDIPRFETEDDLHAQLDDLMSDALAMFCHSGFQDKYGNTPIWQKYHGALEEQFEDEIVATRASYMKERKIAALVEENRQIQLRHERQQKENAEQIKQLEIETATNAVKLEESRRTSKEKEEANQKQLDRITADMKEAKAEDRARYEREAERYRQCIKDERAEKSQAELRHSESVRQINEKMETMRKEAADKEKARIEEVAKLQRQLQDVRNTPSPPKKKRWYKRVFHKVFG